MKTKIQDVYLAKVETFFDCSEYRKAKEENWERKILKIHYEKKYKIITLTENGMKM
jgi:hypothetical protein